MVTKISVEGMTDEQLIAAGRAAMDRQDSAQMELGRLVLEFAPMGQDHARSGIYDRLDLYAEEIGCGAMALRNYRNVASAWDGVDYEGFGFTALRHAIRVEDKQGLIDAMRETQPLSRSGRWTVGAVQDFAKANGFWPVDGDPPAFGQRQIVHAIRRARNGLTRIAEFDWTDEERAELREELLQLALELASAREAVRE